MTNAETNGFTTTHDGQMVYPAGHELPTWAHGWTQCDNRGGGYSTWIDPTDRKRSARDSAEIEAAAKKLRTRAQCEAALKDLGLQPGGSCKDMRLAYTVHTYKDLWPLRQVAR